MTNGARANPPQSPLTEVAVGVVFDRQGRVLIGQRVAGKPYAGWWEFPGGKFEAGEDASAALARELQEELGIDVHASEPWVLREHVYEHAHVRLHFRRVTEWSGGPHSREGQAFVWCDPGAIEVTPLLPAAIEPIRWLGLPRRYLISNATEMGADAFIESFRTRIAIPGARALVLLREPGMTGAALDSLLARMTEALDAAHARAHFPLLVSSRHGRALATRAGGVHLTARDLAASVERPDLARVAASCHDRAQLRQAGALGCDFVVCGPVLPTASHPQGGSLGWPGLAAMIAETTVPVFALGGLKAGDEAAAAAAGAHGIAMQRAAWLD